LSFQNTYINSIKISKSFPQKYHKTSPFGYYIQQRNNLEFHPATFHTTEAANISHMGKYLTEKYENVLKM